MPSSLLPERLAPLLARPVAHRGLHDPAAGRIENTLPAIEAAIRHGFGVEIDVHPAADGGIAVFHDRVLERLTEAAGPLAALSLPELQHIRFRESDVHIPALAEVLDLVAGRVPLLIELKTQRAGGRRTLIAGLIEALATYRGPIGLMSFDPRLVLGLRKAAPDLPRGIITTGRIHGEERRSAINWLDFGRMLHVPGTLPHFLAYDVEALPAPAAQLLRGFGRPLFAWTVRTPDQEAVVRQFADQMIFEGFIPQVPPTAT